MYTDRLLPHDPDAEESVIGSLLIDPESLNRVSSFLYPMDFYVSKNRWCYEGVLSLFGRDEAVNQVTLAHELSLQGRLDEAGGSDYLGHLVATVPTSVHIEQYARIVRQCSVMRQLIAAAGDIAKLGYEGTTDVESTMGRAEELIFNVRTGRETRDFRHIREVLDVYMEESAAVHVAGDHHLAPVSTGFDQIDQLLGGGMQRSDMLVIAARPSLGKSTLAVNIARNAAMSGQTVGMFSLEMSSEQIALRLLASEANVNSYFLRIGHLSESEYRRVLDAIGALSDLPIFIDDTPIQGIVEMRGKARRLQAERGLDLLIVDYLQLIAGSGRSDNRVQEMGEISRSMKGMARDLDIPVLSCSQLSRAVEQRPSHRPMLSDLRESGSIEQDADVVAFIYREDVYTTREEWDRRNPTQQYPENIAELIVSKHRNGPVGGIHLYFKDSVSRFESLEQPAAVAPAP